MVEEDILHIREDLSSSLTKTEQALLSQYAELESRFDILEFHISRLSMERRNAHADQSAT